MSLPNNPRSPLVRLIALGVFKGTPVADLRIGDTLVWNWGGKSQVVKIEPTKSGQSVILYTRSEDGADLPPQRKSLSTLLVLYACGAGCTADPERPSECVRCGRKLFKRPTAARELPIVRISGKRYYRDERLREHRAVDNPHGRLPF